MVFTHFAKASNHTKFSHLPSVIEIFGGKDASKISYLWSAKFCKRIHDIYQVRIFVKFFASEIFGAKIVYKILNLVSTIFCKQIHTNICICWVRKKYLQKRYQARGEQDWIYRLKKPFKTHTCHVWNFVEQTHIK